MTTSHLRKKTKSEKMADFISKIGIPLSLLVLSYATWDTNKVQNDEKMAIEKEYANLNLSLLQAQYSLQKSEGDLNANKVDVDFIKSAFSECSQSGMSVLKRIEVYAGVQYASQKKAHSMSDLITSLCSGFHNDKSVRSPSPGAAELESKGSSLMSKNDFEGAVKEFTAATIQKPVSAELWNQRAYAQFRAGNIRDAFNSIQAAARIGSDNNRTKILIALNTAKILCAGGNTSGAIEYLSRSIYAIPGLKSEVSKDGELTRVCQTSLNLP